MAQEPKEGTSYTPPSRLQEVVSLNFLDYFGDFNLFVLSGYFGQYQQRRMQIYESCMQHSLHFKTLSLNFAWLGHRILHKARRENIL